MIGQNNKNWFLRRLKHQHIATGSAIDGTRELVPNGCTMTRTIFAALLLIALAAPSVWADFDEGLAAAQRGDYATALREWLPLAEKGDATAQYNLGIMYENGWGVPQDPAQAVQWYREAAKSGDIRVILHLATMYSLGKGVPTEFVRAYMFYSIAAEMGDSRGVECRYLHAKAMTSTQITKAKTLAREWRTKHLGKK